MRGAISISKARIIVHCMFDGWMFIKRGQKKGYYIGYSNTNEVLLSQFKSDMAEVYELTRGSERVNNKGVPFVEYGSKGSVMDLLNTTGVQSVSMLNNRVPEPIRKAPEDIKKAFLRAFFDDEGRVVYVPETFGRRIAATSIKSNIRSDAINLLSEIGIPAHEIGVDVIIFGKKNLENFLKLVGFTPGVKVKRKRENSRWYGYEKNELIKLMLSSYT
jgi:intein/homing endonuclease